MSVKKVEMFTVLCDNCGEDVCQGQEYSCWNDEGYAKEIAMESGYISEDDKHYCEDCYEYDDEDNLVIKTVAKKQKSL